VRASPRLTATVRQLLMFVNSLRQGGYEELTNCPICEQEHAIKQSAAEAPLHGPIDRPKLPHPTLGISPDSIAYYLRSLRSWLVDAWQDLLDEQAMTDELPPAPDRYIIGDPAHLRNLAQWFYEPVNRRSRGSKVWAKSARRNLRNSSARKCG
jgi:hypothetical protein